MTRSTYTLRGPADLLAVVPCVLGFHPEQSLVMLTFPTRGRGFHARVDLPEGQPVELAVASLLEAALRHDVDRVAFVAYAEDAEGVDALLVALEQSEAEGIHVHDLLHVADGRWRSLLLDEAGEHDPVAHPFAARSVVEGRVTHRSRRELAATLDPDQDAVVETRAALAAEVPRGSAGHDVWSDAAARIRADPAHRLDALGLAGVLRSLRDETVLEAIWTGVERPHAPGLVEVWTDLVRRSPPGWVAGPAALLAQAAWLTGDGALAWCAVDRALDDDPQHRVARVMATILEEAVPPETWERLGASAGSA